jgi:hypothetical protein
MHHKIPITQIKSPKCSFKPGRGGTRLLQASELRFTVPNQATARALEQEIVGRLARFFPEATPVRIPIKLSRANNNGDGSSNGNGSGTHPSEHQTAHQPDSHRKKKIDSVFLQETVIEFGTSREVLFMVNRPLEFADHVVVESKDGTLHAEASVIAVQYHTERTVVAVRFLQHVPNWIVKS